MEHIKVNLPSNEESYQSGNGEGCWFLVNEETKKAYDNDEKGTKYFGILDNDSVYYHGLLAGTELPIEMRGENRPVVPYNYLLEHYGESNWS